MINFVLCDDNAQYLKMLKTYIDKELSAIVTDSEEYNISQTFNAGSELLEYIKDHQTDVVFLDIDMPELNGFEIAKIICRDYKETKIIFMSAYDNFVYNTFEFYPFAYLRKSHISEELPKVLRRVIDKMREPYRKIVISATSGAKKIDVSSVTHIESNRNYCIVHTKQGEKHTCRGTLSDFEKTFGQYDFFRIHSAFLINLEHVERMLDNSYVLVHNSSLPIAQKRMQSFKKAYMDYVRRCFGT